MKTGTQLYKWLPLLAVACLTASAQTTDFSLTTFGPHHVEQGHYMSFLVYGTLLAGTPESQLIVAVTGLPSGATVTYVTQTRFCCGSTIYSMTDGNAIRIFASSSTPVGAYPMTVSYTTQEGLQRSTIHTLFVDAPHSVVRKRGSYDPPDVYLDTIEQFKSNMISHGLQHCTSTELSVFSAFGVNSYDGTQVYYQIADATGDSSWNACADMAYVAYAKYVNDNNGDIRGYFVFVHGLRMRVARTGDLAARKSLADIMANSAYAYWPDLSYIISWERSREVSYAIEANVADQALGGPVNPHFQDLIEAQIGHFDQWFQSKTSPIVQPFMVGLAAEALINYWDVTKDPRIPAILQLAADQMWTNNFKTVCECFPYYDDEALDGGFTITQDLNLQVASLYGWVYKQTGAQVYRDEGDRIFNSGVRGAWLDGGKQFAQNYAWGGNYIEWRKPRNLAK